MPTPINPQDNLNKKAAPEKDAAQQANDRANKNVSMLAYLYDNTANDLYKAIKSQDILLTDPKIKDRVRWLGEIAKTLSLVYQIESMRAKPKENSLTLPGENIAQVDPALRKANAKQGQHSQARQPQDLSQFGGWTPF